MIARLLISPSIDKIKEEINKTLALHLEGFGRELSRINVKLNHPDILYFTAEDKLGIAQVRKIKEHFSLKPYSAKARGVVLEDAGILTVEAQNALLKTLEEPPKDAILILGASSTANLLPTILSRCETIYLSESFIYQNKYTEDIDRLLKDSIDNRFSYVEKLKDREEFLHFLVAAFREALLNSKSSITSAIVQHNDKNEASKDFLEELLQAEEWAKQNVNIRAILEYLMLVMPEAISKIKDQSAK